MEKDKKGINHTSTDEHKELCDIMSEFMDNGKPKVGIFWYNVALGTLFGVEKEDAENVPFVNGKATIHKLYKTYWQKQHHRAEAKGDTSSIYYQEHNYTMIPRGHIFLDEATERYYVCVGHWLTEGVNGTTVDIEHFREVLEDEFNLPEDFEFVIDYHWDLGHGWSEELI